MCSSILCLVSAFRQKLWGMPLSLAFQPCGSNSFIALKRAGVCWYGAYRLSALNRLCVISCLHVSVGYLRCLHIKVEVVESHVCLCPERIWHIKKELVTDLIGNCLYLTHIQIMPIFKAGTLKKNKFTPSKAIKSLWRNGLLGVKENESDLEGIGNPNLNREQGIKI